MSESESVQRVPGRPGMVIDLSKETQYTDAWIVLILLATLVGVLFQRPALVFIAAVLLAIGAVGWVWDRYCLHGLAYRRHFSETRAFLGEEVAMTVEVENRKWLPLTWVRVADMVPKGVTFLSTVDGEETDEGTGINLLFAPRWREKAQRHYRLLCSARGYYPLGPARMETGDPFGLFSRTWQEDRQEALIVYPRVLAVAEFPLPPKEPLGPLRARQHIFEDPMHTAGPRDYRPEDSLRRIHWPATARRGALQTRVLEPTTEHELVLFFDVTTLPRPYQGSIPERVEQGVTLVASIATYAVERRWPVGLVSNGAIPRSDQAIKLSPSRSPHQLTRIMETLAVITPFATTNIENILTTTSGRLPWGATLAVVVSVINDGLLETLSRLRSAGRQVVLVMTGDVDDVPYHRNIPMLRALSDDDHTVIHFAAVEPEAARR